MIDVVMPQLGESVAEGTVTKWLVREGDPVARQQPIVVVSTDKADTEVTSTATGRVAKLVAREGETLPTGRVLCVIDETASAAAPPPIASPAAAAPPTAVDAGRPLASPSTRKAALEAGVDLTDVSATGERGRITHDDVRRAASGSSSPAASGSSSPAASGSSSPAASGSSSHVVGAADTQPIARIDVAEPRVVALAAPPASRPVAPAAGPSDTAELAAMIQAGGGFVPPIPGVGYGTYRLPPYTPRPGDKVVPFSRRRRITADHMVYSKATAPHVVTVAEVDLHAVGRLRDENKERLKKEGVSLTFLAFVCAAVIKALRESPEINARLLESSYVVLKDINLGIAVDTPGGLIVPNIKQADQLSLRGIAGAIDQLAARARANKVTADDLANTTFTVSNPGMKGNLFGGAIISQPNVGILRMGEIKKRAVVVTKDGEDVIAIHPVMFVALSYDHRIIDGVLANSFLWRVADLLGRGDFEV
jgi:2-oxoglutarate dehydrogenase E2 component (dihydrolipoamide succinyltransferase)